MKYKIRQAFPEDVIPALDLALRVFIEFEAPEYEPIGTENFKKDCIYNQVYINRFLSGDNLMLVAIDMDNEKIIGMIDERGNGDISMLFVDSEYHRQGIATALMSDMVCNLKFQGYNKITLHSSTYAVPFYLNYGFVQTSEAINHYGCIVTPMEYTPKEIWDVIDEHGNKTGRFIERGRKMADGDYNLVVQVWKHNGRDEWLIDKRASKGGSLDGKWETTGGAAVAGDDSLTAALRETKEELGIDLDPNKGTLFNRSIRNGYNGSWLQDTWIFECDIPIESVRFQESETCDAMWATADKIREMIDNGEFLGDWFYPYFDEMMMSTKSKFLWNELADDWDAKMGETDNQYHRQIIRPATLELLNPQSGEYILDAACGTGNFSRLLADIGANVTAFDYSEKMIAYAKSHCTDNINFHIADATNYADLMKLKHDHPFDKAVSNMAVMDIFDIEPMFKSIYDMLKIGGIFVFSSVHPCFQTPNMRQFTEVNDYTGDSYIRSGIQTCEYIKPQTHMVTALARNGKQVLHFHRPLSMILTMCFEIGFLLDGMKEPVFAKPDNINIHKFDWYEIPPSIIIRLRKV